MLVSATIVTSTCACFLLVIVLNNKLLLSPPSTSLGSAVFLGPNVGPLFTQLGIMDEYLEKSKYCNAIRIFNENREQDFFMDTSLNDEM